MLIGTPPAREIGICRAVKAQGWLDALPPAFTRGVVPVRTLVPGGVRHPHPFHKKCEEWNCKHRKINYLTLSEIRTPPVPALAQGHPPHKCGGQGRVPHPPAHHSTNSSTNSNLSNHAAIPSGTQRQNDDRPGSSRLGCPPCGQIPNFTIRLFNPKPCLPICHLKNRCSSVS